MCIHGLSVRQPCRQCADSYHRLIKIDEVDGHGSARNRRGDSVKRCPSCGYQHHDYEPHVPTIVAPDVWADPAYNIESKYAHR